MPPRSRRERPAKPALSREGIVATAVRLMDTDGLQRVTMRRLAQELDTGPASLYVYVRNTAELHAAVLDELLGAVDLRPARASGDWRDRLVDVLSSYTDVLLAHPGLAQSALVARPSGRNYLNLLEALLALLHEGGVPDDQAAWGIDLLLQTATATAAEHSVRRGEPGAEDEESALVEALRTASGRTHPRLAALGSDLVSGTGPERRRWAFHVLINGTLHTSRRGNRS
ncbi:TetR/AcrR family transcriptional regulator C-terminal domain-containing protein [Amycolatopsis endophytica]|uniref:AcrR family transcriptional regulator n=1 Tax=Amycolatopsis endophytica TaxID=860233 RepID=A0A853BFA3_9PSEU|nr:TetR/AcrR family transcriptional regulator [Amycolatopsis endophytica]NYI93321.1 AcrR family transcriptional regulator [Amycolatopsis endophytica]